MRTGLVETWVGNPADVGPMYPFDCRVRGSSICGLRCFVDCVHDLADEAKHENATYAAEMDQLAEAESTASATGYN